MHQAEVDSLIRLKTQPDYAQMLVAELHKDEVKGFRPPLSVCSIIWIISLN